MQASIDSAKRLFDINISETIKSIKRDMDILPVKQKGKIIKEGHLYPEFWGLIKRGFNKEMINKELHCPMNYLCKIKFARFTRNNEVLPMSYFFKKYPMGINKKTCKKVEEMITKYSLKVSNHNNVESNDGEEFLLLRSDFDDLVNAIKSLNISGKYIGLFSWLIDRAFRITPNTMISNSSKIKSTLNKNKALLLKVLYEVNSANLLKCFSNNC